MSTTPLREFSVDPDHVAFVGADLQRPECVLCTDDGGLWISDARGGLTHIDAHGAQSLVVQSNDGEPTGASRPNGIAMDAAGNLLIANMGTRSLETMSPDGQTRSLLSSVGGRQLGQVNFVLRDFQDRLWITVSTDHDPLLAAFRPDIADGYIVLVDGTRARIVADGLRFPNEARTDAEGRWLYVAETTGKRVRRFPILGGGSLGEPELFGPSDLGAGFPDGIAFDALGNLWVAMIAGERVIAITPEGEVETILDAGNADAVAEVEERFSAGMIEGGELAATAGAVAPLTTSVAFGGLDRKTVYLGSLAGSRLATFRSPVAGAPMSHWRR